HGVERLRAAGVGLGALFSPEHGFRGAAAPGEAIGHATDSATGLPIYSLYGRTTSPTDSMLQGLDLLLVDLPDVGARYYTYVSTTIEVMRAAAARGLPVIVLDRPNPIGGAVQGNVLEPLHRSFVGMLTVPMRHGLTLGELARLANLELGLGAALTVVPAAGWHPRDYLDRTGLPFVPPSPNLRSLEALMHYPGTCLFEATPLSVGRGTDAAFELVGAPWLDTTAVLATLRAARLPGVAFEGRAFTPHEPGDGKFADTLVAGIRLRATDREAYDPTATAIHLLTAIRARHPDRWTLRVAHFDRLAGTSRLRLDLEAGLPPDRIVQGWVSARADWERRTRPIRLSY
ncbi:MAG: exo-beta-N-acetylmuramidase NamZ family protein, partial [Gemmatimonadales bacterium]